LIDRLLLIVPLTPLPGGFLFQLALAGQVQNLSNPPVAQTPFPTAFQPPILPHAPGYTSPEPAPNAKEQPWTSFSTFLGRSTVHSAINVHHGHLLGANWMWQRSDRKDLSLSCIQNLAKLKTHPCRPVVDTVFSAQSVYQANVVTVDLKIHLPFFLSHRNFLSGNHYCLTGNYDYTEL
jgi:hypothetical protein